MPARPHALRATAALLALAAAAGCQPRERPRVWEHGQVSLSATTLGEAATQVVRVRVGVSRGGGPDFPAFGTDLARGKTSWSAYLTNIPAGRQRRFDVEALDAAGRALASGWSQADVAAGSPTLVSVVLSLPGTPLVNQAPVIEYLTASANEVVAGGALGVGVSAHDPDPADSIAYAWSATCGSFDDPAATLAVWTAPARAGSCRLTVAASDGRVSVAASLDVAVRGRAVSGTRRVTWWPDPPAAAESAATPDTLTSLPPQLLVADGAGGWTVRAGGHLDAGGAFVEGSFGADGSFVLPDVPPGSYTLCHRPPGEVVTCLDGSADGVDLGFDLLGRPDQTPASVPTPVLFDFSGLDPWNPMLERIEITSSGANLWDVIAHGPDLRGGAVTGQVVADWLGRERGRSLHLLAPADVLVAHQLSARSFYTGADLHLYAAATHASPLPPDPSGLTGFTLRDGQAAAIGARLVALPLSASLAVDWEPAAFEVHGPAMGPAGRSALGASPHRLTVAASAGSLAYPSPAAVGSPRLVDLALPAGAARVAGTVHHGRFLDPRWQEWRGVRFEVEVSYLAAGATRPWVERAALEQREPLPAAPGPLLPALTPVRDLRIGGADALADRSGVGESPRLTWTAPARGTPTGYVVELFRLDGGGGGSTGVPVLRHLTALPEVTVPPGLLAPGAGYFARVSAEASTVPAAAPYRAAQAMARASTLTGIFTR